MFIIIRVFRVLSDVTVTAVTVTKESRVTGHGRVAQSRTCVHQPLKSRKLPHEEWWVMMLHTLACDDVMVVLAIQFACSFFNPAPNITHNKTRATPPQKKAH